MPEWLDKLTGNATHPVLAANLKAGIDTEEKFAALQTGAEQAAVLSGQVTALTAERDTARAQVGTLTADRDKIAAELQGYKDREQAAPDARSRATSAANIAHGKDDQALKHALEDIAATADGPSMERMAARMEAAAKAAVPDGGKKRQTGQTDNSQIARLSADATAEEKPDLVQQHIDKKNGVDSAAAKK